MNKTVKNTASVTKPPLDSEGVARSKEAGRLIELSLAEDTAQGDLTTEALIRKDSIAYARIVAKQNLIVSGTHVAVRVFSSARREIESKIVIPDGRWAKAGETIMSLTGPAWSVLTLERTALNFLQRLSGIATFTERIVKKVKKYNVTILDTRKTVPGFRSLDKYAVRCGGASNHRMGLYDRILIKDNHLKIFCRQKGRGCAEAVKKARKCFPNVIIEIEVENKKDFSDALRSSPDWILLDNMDIATIERCVQLSSGRVKLEVSGGVSSRNITALAATGINAISLGCLTSSVPAADISLEVLDE